MDHEQVVSGTVTLAVYRWGDTGRPTVVLVHGYPDTAAMWRPVAELLADRYHVIAYDVRGAGSSSAPAGIEAYRLDRLVEDLAAVIDHVSPDGPIHLVGHDWGSIQGWEAVTTERLGPRIGSYTSIYAPGLDHAAEWARDRLRRPTPRHVKELLGQQLRSWYVVAFHLPGAAFGWRAFGPRWPGFQQRVEKVAPSADYPAATVTADGRAVVGYVIGTRWSGHGFAVEASRAMIALLHAHVGVRRIEAHIHSRHVASHRVAAHLGMRRTARRDGDGEEIWAGRVRSAEPRPMPAKVAVSRRRRAPAGG